jgi:hypothetical protein
VARVLLALLVGVSLAVLVSCSAPPSGSDGSVGGVVVSPATATIDVGDTVQLTATLTGVVGDPPRGVTWVSGNTNRATVSSTGLVTGVAPGPVAVTATSVWDSTKVGVADVTVTGPGGASTEVMLLANFIQSRIEILRRGGSFNELQESTPLNLSPIQFPTAVAVGPEGRVYVASVSANPAQDPDDPFDDSGIAIYPPAALNGGTVAPVAILTSPLLGNPFALLLDTNGTLWVGNTWQNADPRNPFGVEAFRYVALLGFRDVASITENTVREPDIVLATFQGASPEGFYVGWGIQILSLHLDAGGRLWVTDGNSVTRIDGLADLPDGTVLDLVPGAQIQMQFEAVVDPDDNSIIEPRSAVVDSGGRLYVGNAGNKAVSRFDDAANLTGVVTSQPTLRFFVDFVPTPSLMTIDTDGGLWFGQGTGNTLRRIGSPQLVTNRVFAVPTESAALTPSFGFIQGGLTLAFAP